MAGPPNPKPTADSKRPPEPRRPDGAVRSQLTLMSVQLKRRRFRIGPAER